MTLKLVLFDMDGTVVDSIPAWHATFNDVLKSQGSAPVSYEFFCSDILGQSTEDDVRIFFPKLTPKKLVAMYDKIFPEHIKSVRLFDDTKKILDYLDKRGIKKAIVTNTPRELMILTLDTVGIRDRFDIIVGGDDVAVGKPEPDIIHRACELAKVDEKDALMVGDTKADVNAGKKAGVKTVGVGIMADYRIKSVGELEELIKKGL